MICKLKNVKNIEIIVAVVLALIAAITYFVVTAKTSDSSEQTQATSIMEMDEREAKLARLISEIAGVGRASVLITTGSDKEVVGVVVVAQGASEMSNRVKMIRCVETATGVTVDKIEIFEMDIGG